MHEIQMVKTRTKEEWQEVKHFRDSYFFGPYGTENPYTWTFNHSEHVHLVLYQGVNIIGYAHVQFWPNYRTALRIIVINECNRNQGIGGQFLLLIEQSLKVLGIKSIHAKSRQTSLRFYTKNGYKKMPFDDPEDHESDPSDIPIGKTL